MIEGEVLDNGEVKWTYERMMARTHPYAVFIPFDVKLIKLYPYYLETDGRTRREHMSPRPTQWATFDRVMAWLN